MVHTSETIGILGDGQLAMMLGESAQRRGISHFAVGQTLHSSYGSLFPKHVLPEVTSAASVYTLENEFLSSSDLKRIETQTGVNVIPRPENFYHFESKIHQRRFFESLHIPGPRWRVYQSESDFFDTPFVLKTARGGYDGYGVRFADRPEDAQRAIESWSLHQQRPEILLEEKVNLRREFAQGVLLDGRGGRIYTPLVESIQKNGICILTLSQSTLPTEERAEVAAQAKMILDQISSSTLEGLFHFEFFWTDDRRLLMNEGAPRPHNSAHLMNHACEWSQFDLLVEYLRTRRLPLASGTQLLLRPSIMINLLGQSQGETYSLQLPKLPPELEVYPQLYLKKECRPGRKMGHLNLIDPRATPLSAAEFLELGQHIVGSYRL